jgi:hypothetical protein
MFFALSDVWPCRRCSHVSGTMLQVSTAVKFCLLMYSYYTWEDSKGWNMKFDGIVTVSKVIRPSPRMPMMLHTRPTVRLQNYCRKSIRHSRKDCGLVCEALAANTGTVTIVFLPQPLRVPMIISFYTVPYFFHLFLVIDLGSRIWKKTFMVTGKQMQPTKKYIYG